MASKLAELVFVFYTILVIATVELTKNTSYEAFSQSPLVNIPDAVKTGSPQSQEPPLASLPEWGYASTKRYL